MKNDSTTKELRIRFAPSPTGSVHIGGLRTALFDYLIAKKKGGKFVLRLEDTDQKRFVPGAVEKIINALRWAGIEPDEGVMDEAQVSSQPVDAPIKKAEKYNGIFNQGEYGPYIQSERLLIYREYAEKLVEKGAAYYCFCTSERLEKLRQEQTTRGQVSMYDRCCRNLNVEEIEKRKAQGEKYVIRMKIPDNEVIEVDDLIFGKLKFPSNSVDDQVLIKTDGFPTYHLAVVVDDYLMKITHITRGEEWLPSAPKHVLLYRYLGWPVPQMIHFPNILNTNRKKLSKREGDVSVDDFINKGYLPEAMVNFLALLGWNPKTEQEIFSLSELVEKFDETTIHKAGAVFDYRKLDWINSHYIKQKTDTELLELCQPFFQKYFEQKNLQPKGDILLKIVMIDKERIKRLADITDNIDFYFQDPDYETALLTWKKNTDEQTTLALKQAKDVLSTLSALDFETKILEEKLLTSAGDKRGDLLWPLRVALSGKDRSPSPFQIAWALGKNETLRRIDLALSKL